jgi:hypothetical protein
MAARTPPTGALIATLIAAAAAGRAARADDGSVVIGGAAEDRDRSVVGAAVAATAREAGWAVSRDPVAAQDVDRLFDCSDPVRPWACVPASLGSRGIRRVFVFAVDHRQTASGAPMVVLTAKLILRVPQSLAVRQRFCEHCADDRLTRASTDLARQLLQDLAVRSGRTVLEVRSTPAAARITLDGQPIGATDATFNTFPGRHVVIVEKPGYRAEARAVVAEEGKTASVAVALVAAGAPRRDRADRDEPAPADAAPVARGIAAAVIGSGAALALGGGALLVLGSRDGPSDKYRYAGATSAGALLGLAGAAGCVTGIVLWRRAPAAAASLGITGGAVVAGWATAF